MQVEKYRRPGAERAYNLDLSEDDKPTHLKRHGSRRVTAADSREVAADELTGRRQTVGRQKEQSVRKLHAAVDAGRRFKQQKAGVDYKVTFARLLSRVIEKVCIYTVKTLRQQQRFFKPQIVIWLILPVVICLSQRLSHASVSTSSRTVKLRMAH